MAIPFASKSILCLFVQPYPYLHIRNKEFPWGMFFYHHYRPEIIVSMRCHSSQMAESIDVVFFTSITVNS